MSVHHDAAFLADAEIASASDLLDLVPATVEPAVPPYSPALPHQWASLIFQAVRPNPPGTSRRAKGGLGWVRRARGHALRQTLQSP